uniref:OmpA family protein n=1 Tax=Bordetella sputigena TaxID=1416810 RepID=UPI0039EDEA73
MPGDTNSLQSTFASNDPCAASSRNTGAVIGGVLGAVAGALLAGKNGNNRAVVGAIGAGAGALVGGAIGHNIDQRRCALSKVAKANNLDLLVSSIKIPQAQVPSATQVPGSSQVPGPDRDAAGLSVSIIDKGGQFAPGSVTLLPEAAKAMAELAETYRRDVPPNASANERNEIEAQNKAMRILLVGHTDDTGSSQANADLSEARARSVARIFVSQGFSEDQIFYQGAGETLPIADNHSEEGRARNRRVEVVDLSKDAALAGYLANRKPILAYYRAAEKPAAKPALASARGAVSTASSVPSAQAPSEKPAADLQAETGARTSSAESARVATPRAGGHDIDFGGSPVNGRYTQVSIGNLPAQKSALSFLRVAHADAAPIAGSCADDRPRISNGVKSLKNDREANFVTSDYLPGVYDSSWTANVNGHLVALIHVAVLRDGGSPARRPELLVYANYSGDSKVAPTFRSTPEVNAYQGSEALLYRVFVDDSLQCMDIVIPNKDPSHAPNSNLAYALAGRPYQTTFSPSLVRQ